MPGCRRNLDSDWLLILNTIQHNKLWEVPEVFWHGFFFIYDTLVLKNLIAIIGYFYFSHDFHFVKQ
jgi:hypothetical protein